MTGQNDTLRILENPPLSRDLRDFLLDVCAANRSEGTLRFYRQKLTPFVYYLQTQGIEQGEDIRASHIRAYLSELGKDHSPGGVHAYWRAIRAFVRFLVREDILDTDLTRKVRAPKVDIEPLEPVDLESLKAMLAVCDKSEIGLRDKSVLVTLLDKGIQVGEATALNVGDLDLNDGSILVRKSKNHKPRTVFVGRRTRRTLAAYLRKREDPAPGAPLWLAYSTTGGRGRLGYTGLRDILRRRAKEAGVEAPTPHSYRRGFAITMLRAGADLVSLSRMMGHGSLAVLMRYLKQLPGDLEDA